MVGKIMGLHIRHTDKKAPSMPKMAVERATIQPEGLLGDFNQYRHKKVKDSPDMAVMLWPDEERAQLNLEGWPIQPGDIGENILTSGLPSNIWQDGTRLRVGEAVELELRERCEPCSNLAKLGYVGAQHKTAFIKCMVGRRGYYARVLSGGHVQVGDTIEVLSVPESKGLVSSET
ncbi:MAG: MOSC domain-containing protein [Myxococcota bacterium]